MLALLVTFVFSGRVGYLRGKYKVDAPATVGNPDFERGFRIHANTVENLVLFVPLLWLATVYYGGQLAFWIGLIWVLSRVVYAYGYAQTNTQMRGPGAGIGYLCLLALAVLAVIGIAR